MVFKIAVVYGSVRTEREGIKAARFIVKKLEEKGHQVTLVDPAEHRLPLLDKRYKDYPKGTAPDVIEQLAGLIRDSDGFVFVSGEYNHGVPPALKNLIDHFQREYYFKPAGMLTYSGGPFGGVRVAMPLREMLAELGMAVIPTSFPVSGVQDAFDEKGKAIDASYDRRVKTFVDELEWYLEALDAQRKKGKLPY
jgi:NAD(P)H-dependent FMN reductase